MCRGVNSLTLLILFWKWSSLLKFAGNDRFGGNIRHLRRCNFSLSCFLFEISRRLTSPRCHQQRAERHLGDVTPIFCGSCYSSINRRRNRYKNSKNQRRLRGLLQRRDGQGRRGQRQAEEGAKARQKAQEVASSAGPVSSPARRGPSQGPGSAGNCLS